MWSSNQQPHNGVKTLTSRPASHNNVNGGSSAKQLGMTPAVSLAGPRPEDLQRSLELRLALEPHNVFESEDELKHRMQILAKLNSLVRQWIKDVSIAKHMPEAYAQKLGGKVYTFGSYRLGVHHKGADIDALCVAPRNIERSDYFTSFFALLKRQPEVTECRAIEEAFVPVIKMKFDGIEIDLLFARLSLKEIPDDFDLSDDNILKNLDGHSVRSLNGCRVTDEILAMVPNVENFSLALRTIKLWAKKHGVYSNSLGYFGGVTWAMLMAKTCQLYPNATASTLVHKFFLVLSTWKWPIPVLLKQPDSFNSRFPVWDPRVNLADRYHLMPVITPAYPQQNSTFNVSESTKKIIVMEINRGKNIMDEIMLDGASWDRLFQAPSFFYRYRHFIVLLVNSQTADDHLEWCGLVESKIRLLVGNLERNQHISLAHVNPKCFEPKKGTNNNNVTCSQNSSSSNEVDPAETTASASPFCSLWFIGLEFERAENLNVDLTESILNFTEHVMHLARKTKMLKPDMSIEARHVKRKQLSQYLDADLLLRERKSMQCQNSSTNTITAKRKRLSGEMLQADSNSNGNGKKTRHSESSEENSNGSSSDTNSSTKSTANTMARKTSPKCHNASKNPAKAAATAASALSTSTAAAAASTAALASSTATAALASSAASTATTTVKHPPYNELLTTGATATSTSTITYKSLSQLYLKRSLSSTTFTDLTT